MQNESGITIRKRQKGRRSSEKLEEYWHSRFAGSLEFKESVRRPRVIELVAFPRHRGGLEARYPLLKQYVLKHRKFSVADCKETPHSQTHLQPLHAEIAVKL